MTLSHSCTSIEFLSQKRARTVRAADVRLLKHDWLTDYSEKQEAEERRERQQKTLSNGEQTPDEQPSKHQNDRQRYGKQC